MYSPAKANGGAALHTSRKCNDRARIAFSSCFQLLHTPDIQNWETMFSNRTTSKTSKATNPVIRIRAPMCPKNSTLQAAFSHILSDCHHSYCSRAGSCVTCCDMRFLLAGIHDHGVHCGGGTGVPAAPAVGTRSVRGCRVAAARRAAQ